MSGFVLRRFIELVGEGVKTDKGFKDVHLNRVAKDLSEFTVQDISGSQVYKNLSGANWDEENCMITLAPEHYVGHVKDHSKDAEFLNVPLVNYPQMQAIFASGVVTGSFAMGSNEALGEPTDADTMQVDDDATAATVDGHTETTDKARTEGSTLGKRKSMVSEDDGNSM
ncbi:unnamed protein product [Urochloa humidicola]